MSDLSYLKGVAGLKNYYSLWTGLIDWVQSFGTEVETARQGQPNLNAKITAMDSAASAVTTEVNNAREGQSTLLANFGRYVLKTGPISDLPMNNNKITNLKNATAPKDAVPLEQVQSLISGGGSPSNIAVTSLNIGTATSLQLYRVNAAGNAIEGVNPSALSPIIAPSLEVTQTNKGTAQNGHVIGVRNGVVIGRNLTYDLMLYRSL